MSRILPRAVAALCLAAASCGGEAAYEGPPVLVLAVDGLTWDVLEPLVAAGEAPAIAGLLARGVGGELASERPTYSPRLWTTVATGVGPAEHGILGFAESDERGRMRPDGLPYTSNTRAAPALWNLAGDAGRSVCAVAWWVSWPAEPVREGRIVASYAAQAQARVLWKPIVWEEGLPELTWPPELAERLAPTLAAGAPDGPLRAEYDARFGAVPPEWRFPAQRERFFRGVFHADRTHQRVFTELVAEDGPADLNLLYFGLADVAGHYFWRWHEPQAFRYEVPAAQTAFLGDHVRKAYRQVDAWVGEVLAAFPEDTLVLLVSDHGMVASNVDDVNNVQSGGHLQAPPGVFVLSGPGVVPRGLLPLGERELGSLYDVAPTVLDLLGVPAGQAMHGDSLRGRLDPAWRAAHPRLDRVDHRAGFRPATPPRVPMEGLDRTFLEAMDQLGYTGG